MTVRGQGFASLYTVSEALEVLEQNVAFKVESEVIATHDSCNRMLKEDIHSPVNLPGFQRSAMDGYAVIAEDTYGASTTNPIQLRIAGSVEIGDTDTPHFGSGEAVKISTGAPIPDDANAVVKMENTENLGKHVELYSAISPGKNVADHDEDVKKGELILQAGTLIRPWDIAILESMGIDKIEVLQKPKIATLSTGNELVPSGSKTSKGEVIDSNRPAINAWIEDLGGEVVKTGHCEDSHEIIASNIIELSKDVDMIVTTGGTSVGSKDFLGEVIKEIGDLWVHGIAIRPGKPVALGKIDHLENSVPIIALPGYPLAAFLNFNLFVTPPIIKVTGIKPPWERRKTVKLNQKIPSKSGYVDFVRLKQQKDGAEIVRITGAGILSSLVKADYLLMIPENVEGYSAGDEVEVIILR